MRMFEDLPVGERLPLAPYHVSREEIVEFATEFDPQPFHLDDAAGEASLLGGLAASGWHTCAMMMKMAFDGHLKDIASQGSPGAEHVRWMRPVRPGETLGGHAGVTAARRSASRPHLGLVTFDTDVTDSAGQTVLSARYTVMVRAGAEAAR
ncbi:MaoC family dehydratase [Aureimonas mangrovi]|uniref:MaoC family dehydratase n=1 Tax=Aureimonas mangrovi TaxID=2758041 RepID=UPI00163D5413|nr:MaoC family dehydratase [Aureimonas mangrovi]